MANNIGKKISRLPFRLARRAFRRWKGRAKAGWKRELAIWRRTKHPPNRRQALGLLTLVGTAPMMWYVAYNAGPLVALSFTFSAFMAISYATFFSSPLVFILIYVGVLVGQAANAYFFKATDAAIAGDLTGAALVGAVGVGIWLFSNRLKEGKVMPKKTPREGSRRGRSTGKPRSARGRRRTRF